MLRQEKILLFESNTRLLGFIGQENKQVNTKVVSLYKNGEKNTETLNIADRAQVSIRTGQVHFRLLRKEHADLDLYYFSLGNQK